MLMQYAMFLVLMVTAEIVLGVVIAVMHEQVRITRSADQLNCLAVFGHSPGPPASRSHASTITSSFHLLPMTSAMLFYVESVLHRDG